VVWEGEAARPTPIPIGSRLLNLTVRGRLQDLVIALRQRFGSFRWALETVGPAASVVMDAEDLQCVVMHAIGDDDRCVWNDKFARVGHTAGCPEFWIFEEVTFDDLKNECGDALRGARVIPRDIVAQVSKVFGRLGRPDDPHVMTGSGRSPGLPHEATHSLMGSCGTPKPASRDAIAQRNCTYKSGLQENR
jgi:hypothetical protein